MKLQIRGIPRSAIHVFTIEPAQSGALLGRMEGDQSLGLAVPIPHIEQPNPGEPTTLCWSRKHLRFDFQGGAWFVTLLGKQRTLLDERELAMNAPTRLPSEASLRCGDVTLRVSVAVDNRYATRVLNERPPEVQRSPFDTIAIRPEVRPQVADSMERMSIDNLGTQARTMGEQLRNELDQLTRGTREMPQRRGQAEQCRDEARVALAAIRQAASLPQLQSAAERVRDAAARARRALDQAGSVAATARQSVERARDIERSLKNLSTETVRAVSRLPPGDPVGRILTSQTSQAEEEAQRRMAEIEDLGHRLDRERDQLQAVDRFAKEAEEEAMALVSRREGEFRRRERTIAYAKRYSMIGLVLVSAILIGLLLGKLLEGNNTDPLGEGQGSLRTEPQEGLKFVQVADHALQVAANLHVDRGIDQELVDEEQALQRVEQLALAALPVDPAVRMRLVLAAQRSDQRVV